jgi:hypothetical protein
MANTSLEKLERQYEQAKARLQSARARKVTKDRKLDARRKIILGGALIEKASRDPEVTRLLMALVAGLSRVQDRKAFDGWSPPAPEREASAGGGLEGDGNDEVGGTGAAGTNDGDDSAVQMERRP